MRWIIVVLLLLLAAYLYWPEPEPVPVEETFIGDQVRALEKSEAFEQQYLNATDARKQRMEDQIDNDTGD